MPIKKKYVLDFCNDCHTEFLSSAIVTGGGKRYCPLCGDNINVTTERYIWIEKLFNQKQPWTGTEDQTIIYGREHGATWEEVAETLDHRTRKAAIRRGQQLRKKGLLK